MWLDKRLSTKECVRYIVSQVLGAFAGSLLLALCLGSFKALGANGYGGVLFNGNEVTAWTALLVEVILTFFFVLVILNVTSKKEHSNMAGLLIGLTLTLVHLFGIGVTGTSVNPARSLAPAILQGGKALAQVWVFILAPILGSILATLFYKKVTKVK